MKKIVLLGTAFFLLSASAHAGLFRWIDEAGNVHYSDKIPASASTKKHTKIGSHGLVKEKIDPQALIDKSIQNEESLTQQAIEEKRLATIAKINREKSIVVHKRDSYLLSTYDTKDELSHFFETKIKMLEGNSNILTTHNLNLKKKINRVTREKSATKNKATVASLDKKIIRIGSSIKQYEKALEENATEIVKLSQNYKLDMQRYIELTNKQN